MANLHLIKEANTREQRCWDRARIAAADASTPDATVEELLVYLEAYPLGVYNRVAAQSIEDLLHRSAVERRDELYARFRALRDPLLPTSTD